MKLSKIAPARRIQAPRPSPPNANLRLPFVIADRFVADRRMVGEAGSVFFNYRFPSSKRPRLMPTVAPTGSCYGFSFGSTWRADAGRKSPCGNIELASAKSEKKKFLSRGVHGSPGPIADGSGNLYGTTGNGR